MAVLNKQLSNSKTMLKTMQQLGYVEELLRKKLLEGVRGKHQFHEKLGRMKKEN